MHRILLTSTSFIDTPGAHQVKLDEYEFKIDKLRGPLKENEILSVIEKYDGLICGDDEITSNVIDIGASTKLKIISKYGVGLDKIDLSAAKKHGIIVTNCPGCNQVAVAEHVFSLLLTYTKNIHSEYNIVQKGEWTRLIGNEIFGKSLGIIGLGSIGKEVAKRASCFGLKVFYFDPYISLESIKKDMKLIQCTNLNELFEKCEIVTLHLPLNTDTFGLINKSHFRTTRLSCKTLINTSRASIIDQIDLLDFLDEHPEFVYLTDVLEEEPIKKDHPLLDRDNVLITPHIGSRTYESVQRQGLMAVDNLVKGLTLIETRK